MLGLKSKLQNHHSHIKIPKFTFARLSVHMFRFKADFLFEPKYLMESSWTLENCTGVILMSKGEYEEVFYFEGSLLLLGRLAKLSQRLWKWNFAVWGL